MGESVQEKTVFHEVFPFVRCLRRRIGERRQGDPHPCSVDAVESLRIEMHNGKIGAVLRILFIYSSVTGVSKQGSLHFVKVTKMFFFFFKLLLNAAY